MDRTLADRLNQLNKQNQVLKEEEKIYLELEANRKPLLAKLTIKAEGKSFSERESIALASPEWRDFAQGLVIAEVQLNYAKRRYEILDKAFLAEYSSMKLDGNTIRRGSAVT